jgi:hypothetical protein
MRTLREQWGSAPGARAAGGGGLRARRLPAQQQQA